MISTKADKRAEEIVKKITDDYENYRGIFAERVNAEESMPKKMGDRQKSLFLFFVTNLDHGMKSQILYDGARKLFEHDKKLFEPEHIVKKEEGVLVKILAEYVKPRYPNVAAMQWKKNSELLLEKYEGDPRKIFEYSEAEIVLRKIKGFKGMGDKTGTLFFRTMVNIFKYDYLDIKDVMQPVDVHDMRLSYLLGVMNKEESRNVDEVREVWNNACKKTGRSWLIFDKAMWLIGSQGCRKRRCNECSVKEYCNKEGI